MTDETSSPEDHPGELTPAMLLMFLDTAMLQLSNMRTLVVAYIERPAYIDGGCKHLHTLETFTGTWCKDCTKQLEGDPEQDNPLL